MALEEICTGGVSSHCHFFTLMCHTGVVMDHTGEISTPSLWYHICPYSSLGTRIFIYRLGQCHKHSSGVPRFDSWLGHYKKCWLQRGQMANGPTTVMSCLHAFCQA